MKLRMALPAFLLATPALADGWLPEAATVAARSLDRQFFFLVAVAAGVLVLLFFAFDVLLLMNLRGKANEVGSLKGRGRRGRLLMLLVAAVLAVGLFVSGARGYLDAAMAPGDSLAIEAQWQEDSLSFLYGGVESDSLHLPTERNVRLTLRSDEGPATLAIPAFRLRRTTRPELPTEVWFQADQPGEYPLTTSRARLEQTSEVASTVTVHTPAEFDSWLESISDVLLLFPPAEAGEILLERKGCLVCHTTDGSRLTGPSFLGVLGRESRLAGGKAITVDDAYVRRSILEPTADVVEGFQPVMPSFAGRIRDAEIDAILTYFRTLSETEETP